MIFGTRAVRTLVQSEPSQYAVACLRPLWRRACLVVYIGNLLRRGNERRMISGVLAVTAEVPPLPASTVSPHAPVARASTASDNDDFWRLPHRLRRHQVPRSEVFVAGVRASPWRMIQVNPFGHPSLRQ
jgi:hypothetical protein